MQVVGAAMPRMTIAEYARHRGVTRPAVYQAIAAGKVRRYADGTVDSDEADVRWPPREVFATHPRPHQSHEAAFRTMQRLAGQAERPARVRQRAAPVDEPSQPALVGRRKPARAGRPVEPPQAAAPMRGAADAVGEDAPDHTDATGGASSSYLAVRMRHEAVRAASAALKLRKQRGELIEVSKVAALVTREARALRDGLLALPVRVAGQLAAEWGIDPHRVQEGLTRELTAYLSQMAMPRMHFGDDGSAS